jgi:hypothetical protein
MKLVKYIIISLLVISCNSKDAPDCFKNSGDLIQKEFTVEAFTKITSFKNVELIITQGDTQQVIVETGEFLIDDIEVRVEDDTLLLKDNTGCNYTRDYGITKVYVTAPNLTTLRNSSNFDISSNGVLNYESLSLASEDFNSDFYSIGNFNLEVNTTNLSLVINNLSTSYISGTTTNLRVFFASGDGRFEGRNLIAQNVDVYHRGTNDIIVNPQLSLKAKLVSTGDLRVVNTPPNVDVEVLFDGGVIYE